MFGPHPWDGKIWQWAGPDGFNSTDRENTLRNLDGTKSGFYTVTYTNETGCRTVAKIKMVVDDPEHPYTDSTTSIFARDYRNRHKDMRLNRGSVYFDLLGNRLPKKPKNSVYIKR